jgi:hypothetical protein
VKVPPTEESSASVMGRSESIPRFHLAAGYLLPSVVGARAAT